MKRMTGLSIGRDPKNKEDTITSETKPRITDMKCWPWATARTWLESLEEGGCATRLMKDEKRFED